MSRVTKYFLLSLPITSCGLGYWQIERLQWKKNMIANLESKLVIEPIDLLSLKLPEDLEKLEYHRVKVKGNYNPNPDNQVYLRPRQLIMNVEAANRGKNDLHSNFGVNVITPFKVDGANMSILVNRGWLAMKGKDSIQDSPHLGLENNGESTEIVGIVRKTDKKSTYGVYNDPTRKEWPSRDIPTLSKALGTEPIYIDLVADPKRREGPIGGQTALQIRNEHLNYAITWFSLGALTLALWYGMYGKRKSILSKFAR